MRVPIRFDFVQPTFNMCKCFSPGYIVDQQCTDGTSVVGPCDGPKIFLACSVPNLQFNTFILDWDGFCPKLHTDSNIMSCPSFVLDELKHNARLSHTCITDDDEFKQVIVIVHKYYIIRFFLFFIPLHTTTIAVILLFRFFFWYLQNWWKVRIFKPEFRYYRD